MNPVRWGVLSTAGIGATVIGATAGSPAARFTAVASRALGKAQDFAAAHQLPYAYGSYEELLASDSVDAVYVALPSALHTEWTVKALGAGKHVLCEKPFALDPEDAARCFDAAEAAGLLCAEGFMYRHHPGTALARRLLADGAIGELRHIRAALTVSVPEGDIRRSRALGGGALLDLGCYCVSAVRLFGGAPERVYAEAVRDDRPDGVDVRFSATLRLPGGVVAQFDTGLDLPRRDELELIGTAGRIVLADPWLCREKTVCLIRADGTREELPADPEGLLAVHEDAVYRHEIETVSAAVREGRPLEFGRGDAVEQAQVLAALRESGERGEPVRVGL